MINSAFLDNLSIPVKGLVNFEIDKFTGSLFNHKKDNKPKSVTGTIRQIFPPHITREFTPENKDGVMFSPAIYKPGTTRANVNVVEMGELLCLDLDKIINEHLNNALERIKHLAMFYYTTSSHTGKDGELRYRLIIVLNRKLSANEYKIVLRRVNIMLGELNDESCKDPARCFFRPMSSAANVCHREYVIQNGRALDVDKMLDLPTEYFPLSKKREKNVGRNNTLTSIAGKLRSKGSSRDEIYSQLQTENNNLFSDNPLTDQELQSISNSIARYPAGREPRLSIDIARDVIEQYSIISFDGRTYRFSEVKYVEVNKSELTSFIVRHLDSEDEAEGVSKKKFEEISFFVASLSARESAPILGKPLANTDDSADYINLQNGILRITRKPWQLEILPHSNEYFLLDVLPYPYNLDATCPIWLDYLNKAKPDLSSQQFIGEWFGYNLIHDTSLARFVALIGEGANGKSVAILVLMLLLGPDAFCSVGLDAITPDNRFGLTPLIGMKANIVGDMNMTSKFSEGLFKEMVSGGIFTADRKHQAPTKVQATARHTFAMNELPKVKDRSEGIFRRMTALPFNVVIPKDQQNREMIKPKYWIDSGELPGIFNWSLIHLKNLLERGDFIIPLESEKILSEFRLSVQPEKEFLFDTVEPFSESLVPLGELYFHYKVWAKENGYFEMSQAAFGKEVQRNFKVQRTPNAIQCKGSKPFKNRDRHWIGLRWKKLNMEDEVL